jgi:zinc protease
MRYLNLLKTSVLATTLTFASFAQANLSEYQLDNGMQVLVKVDNRSPVVVHQVWYRIGSTYEQNGNTGISHMLEHMMFKGTKTMEPGQFSKIVAKLGGRENAFTSTDYTAYYQIVGKQHLETVMKLEADRMRNVVLTDEEFYKERNVVAEERRMRIEDKPNSKLYEQFKATAFLSSPIRHPVIGWMQDVQNWTAEDSFAWYQKWYSPNNATLVVVGDVDPKEVYQYAKTYYGKHSPEQITVPKPQLEIQQEGERRIVLKENTKLSRVLMGFHAPTLVTAKEDTARSEVYALEVLSSILSGDDSSRLSKNLVRKGDIVLNASASYSGTDRLQTLFTLGATPAKGQTPEAVEQALWDQIELLQTELVTQDELDRVLAQAEAQYIYHQDSIQSQAIILGSLVSVGLPVDTLDQWVDNLRQVTPEQIRAVAQKYFDRNKQTVAVLLPKEVEKNDPKQSKQDVQISHSHRHGA